MATSTADEKPRGMEFLYSLHRLNVGTSRARCVAARPWRARDVEMAVFSAQRRHDLTLKPLATW